ncbi:MAG: hypothetical protein K6F05_05060 [Succinivibrio sp.]|nr:hypothetical protein [Succinivibrio sp.]
MAGKACILLCLGVLFGMSPATYGAGQLQSGWSLGQAYMWRLNEDPDYAFTKGTPAKIYEVDRRILNHQAKYTLRNSLTNVVSFKVGCVFQSKTPVFELQTQPLDISIQDQFDGFAFVRFIIDNTQEFSLRGEYTPPGRLVFLPLTQSQDKKLSNLLLQMREGGELKMAILQGKNSAPREFTIPLKGFIELSDKVISDCQNLNTKAGSYQGEVKLLPDYLTEEPKDKAPEKYTLKIIPKNEDGLTPPPPEPKPEPKPAEEPKPETVYFEPGGGAASIGPDGKPLMKPQDESLGKAQGPMQIGPDGKPVDPAAKDAQSEGGGEAVENIFE